MKPYTPEDVMDVMMRNANVKALCERFDTAIDLSKEDTREKVVVEPLSDRYGKRNEANNNNSRPTSNTNKEL